MKRFFQELERLTVDILELAGVVEESVRDSLRALGNDDPTWRGG